jgi:hypothetical protein
MHPAHGEIVFYRQIDGGHNAMMLSTEIMDFPPTLDLCVQAIKAECHARALPSYYPQRFATTHIDLPQMRKAGHG